MPGAGNPGATGVRRQSQLCARRTRRPRAPLGPRCGGPGCRLRGRRDPTPASDYVCPSRPQAKHPPDAFSGADEHQVANLPPPSPPKKELAGGAGNEARRRASCPRKVQYPGWQAGSLERVLGTCPLGRPKGDKIKGLAWEKKTLHHPPALLLPPPRLSQVLTRAEDSPPPPSHSGIPWLHHRKRLKEGGTGEGGLIEGRKVAGLSALPSTGKTRPADPPGCEAGVGTLS